MFGAVNFPLQAERRSHRPSSNDLPQVLVEANPRGAPPGTHRFVPESTNPGFKRVRRLVRAQIEMVIRHVELRRISQRRRGEESSVKGLATGDRL